jgi:lysophospholipase L1-like esterase
MYAVASYDENKKYIANSRTTETSPTKYIVPEGASFVRVSYAVAGWNENGRSGASIVICDNPVIFPFSEYGTVVRKSIKNEFAPNGTVKAFLPKEICVAVGRTIELYNNQVCVNAEKYHIQWDCEIGLALDRKFSVTGTTALIGEYLAILYIKDDDLNTVWYGSTIIKVVPATTNTFSICCIGDSLTNNKPWLNELKVLDENISFVGTCGTAPYNHEGRSGIRAVDYLGTTMGVTPFWNATEERFDWNYYVTNSLGGVQPDAVQIFLGTNGIALNPTYNANHIKTMIDYIRQDNTDIQIFIVNTLYRSNQDGIGRQINTDGFNGNKKGTYKYAEDVKVFNLMVELDRILDGYENVHFVPVATCHDSANNFGKVEVAINPRATDKEYMPVEGTHPQEQGYLQMADIMFSTFSAYMTEEVAE